MIVDIRNRLEIIVIVYVVRDRIVDVRERLEIVGIVGALPYAPRLMSHTQGFLSAAHNRMVAETHRAILAVDKATRCGACAYE